VLQGPEGDPNVGSFSRPPVSIGILTPFDLLGSLPHLNGTETRPKPIHIVVYPKTSVCGQQRSGSCDLLDSGACNADNEGVFGQLWHRADGGNAVHSWSRACLSFRLARRKVLKTAQGNATINDGDVPQPRGHFHCG
jgi:hypothetical protein